LHQVRLEGLKFTARGVPNNFNRIYGMALHGSIDLVLCLVRLGFEVPAISPELSGHKVTDLNRFGGNIFRQRNENGWRRLGAVVRVSREGLQ
jgi:hypothetical protein